MGSTGFRPRTTSYCISHPERCHYLLARPEGRNFRLVSPVGHNLCVDGKGPNNGRAFRDAPCTDVPSGLITMSWTQTFGGRTNSRCSDSVRRFMRAPTHGARRQASIKMEEKNGRSIRNSATLKQCSRNSGIRPYGSAAPMRITQKKS